MRQVLSFFPVFVQSLATSFDKQAMAGGGNSQELLHNHPTPASPAIF